MSKLLTKNNLTLLLQIGLFFMCIFLITRNPKQVYPVSSQKVIERRIAGKERIIEGKTIEINNDKNIINSLNEGLLSLQDELAAVKNSKDTFNIVQIQDTMIGVLYNKINTQNNIIQNQDTIIQAQRYIINSKDTIIATKDFDIKRIKKQRNLSFLANGILTGILILKK
jgi:hypothetical protein